MTEVTLNSTIHSNSKTWCITRLDNDSIAHGGEGGCLSVITADAEWRIELQKSTIHFITVSPDGTRILIGGQISDKGYCLKVLDAANIRDPPLKIYDLRHTDTIYSACFSPSGDRILTCSGDRCVKLIKSDDTVIDLLGHEDMVYSGGFTLIGTERIVTCSYDKSIRFWDSFTGEAQLKIEYAHEEAIYCCSFSPSETIFATASGDKTVKIWSSIDGKLKTTFASHTSYVYCCKFSPNGLYLISSSADQTVKLWSLESCILQAHWKAHDADVNCCAFISDSMVASASSDFTMRIWKIVFPNYEEWKDLILAKDWFELKNQLRSWIQSHKHIVPNEILNSLMLLKRGPSILPTQKLILLQILSELSVLHVESIGSSTIATCDALSLQLMQIDMELEALEARKRQLLCLRSEILVQQSKLAPQYRFEKQRQVNLKNTVPNSDLVKEELQKILDFASLIRSRDLKQFLVIDIVHLILELDMPDLRLVVEQNKLSGENISAAIIQHGKRLLMKDRCKLVGNLNRIHNQGQLLGTNAAYLDCYAVDSLYDLLKQDPELMKKGIPNILNRAGIDGQCLAGIENECTGLGIDYESLRAAIERIVEVRRKVFEEFRQRFLAADPRIPNLFVCPLSHTLMQTPVIAADGFTYEHSAIEDWSFRYKKSPMTGVEMLNPMLRLHEDLQNLMTMALGMLGLRTESMIANTQ